MTAKKNVTEDTLRVGILEERVCNMIKENSKEHNEILDQIERINEKLDVVFVTKAEFDPIKRGFYGVVSIILTAVALAIIRLISSHQVL